MNNILNHKIIGNSYSAGKWLVFISGYTGTFEAWELIADMLLARKECSILLIDNLGAGMSPQPSGAYTSDLMAEAIINTIEHLQISSFSLIGHSLGGAIAQKIALKFPQHIENLFLLSSFAKLDHISRLFLTNRYELLKQNTDKSLVALASIPTLFANAYLANLDNISAAINSRLNNPQTLDGMFGQLQACLQHDTVEQLPQIQCNTVIVSGDQDILVNLKHSELMRDQIPNSKMHIIESAGHMIQLEQPLELANIINSYI